MRASTDAASVTITDLGMAVDGDDEALTMSDMMPHSAGEGWQGSMHTRSDEETGDETATVYTNIDPAGDEKYEDYYSTSDAGDKDGVNSATDEGVLTLDTTAENVVAAAKLGLYSAAMFPTVGRQFTTYAADDPVTTDVDESERMFAGMFHGVPGKYICTATGQDTCEATADNDGNLATLTGTWTFTPTDYEADKYMVRGVTPDADHLHFGYWLESTEAEDGTTSYKFQAFSGGAPVFDSNQMSDVVGTATYKGLAGGMYVRKVLTSTGEVETATHGSFTAHTNLKANFGGDDVPVNDKFSISGTVENFMDGDVSLDGWTVKLNKATFGDNASNFGGTTEGSETADPGAWSGQFYGSSDDVDGDTPQPSGVAGEFDASFPNGAVNGAFGAELQD